ncbi:SusC/RagA family TonB-linked outer membrane protein [Hymenobacter cheonanensis]|uniref:SusC/RagA family TonB-linked outer membrane protein n=1 Tax=Hymenobacter sp. CA2-7 TaxID=3063993 RepID=UPI002712EB8A|nr:SusC/RagA family TonB-linked outer membrane protein [Hymenobacter sp. CA2-7]MDO7884564.1 SusC/RagA family TonB-linked outer membrane protein [Hymenobacter sp. CA2-7]
MKQFSTNVSTRLECFRRSLAPTLVLTVLAASALAQTQAVSGRVTAAGGDGLPGVNVVVKGTSVGTTTNAEGSYSLAVPGNAAVVTLTFSFVGYKPQDVVVGNQTAINVTLGEDTKQLDEVVVTALGIRKEARTIGYTTQEIAGAQLVKAREPNPVNALTGKIAGLTVAPSAELLGRPQLILRGNSDLLFVVDGVPINSDTWNISPDDIETYTVLKGPNAAALYGFRGQNGAIMITTKRGTGDKRKVAVEFNSSTQIQPSFLAIPERQNEYGFGSNYQYAYTNDLYDLGNVNRRANIWGPRFEGQPVPQYDSPVVNGVRQGTPWLARGANNFRDFMGVGVLSANNVSVSSSGDNYDVRLSVSNNYQKGLVPNTGLNITNFNLSTGVHFNTRLRFDGALNLSLQNSPNIPQTSSGPESETYIFQVYGSASWALSDMRDYYKGPQGVPGVQQYYAEYGRGNNPYFVAYEWLYGHKKTDLYGYGRLSYKLSDHLNLALRSQVTTWNQLRTEKVPYSAITYKTPDLRQGDYREDRRNLLENNTDLLLTYNQDLGQHFSLSAVAGANARLFNYNASWATTDFLIVPGVYNFSNSKNPAQAYDFSSDMTVLSAYATTDLTWKNIASLGLTGRFDKLSTLPAKSRTIFYPSVSLSTVLNDYLPLPEAISFIKLRGSFANVKGGNTQSTIGSAYQAVTGNSVSSLIGYGSEVTTPYDGPSYVNQNSYTITKPYNNQPAASYTSSLANPNLRSFSVTSYEYGMDAKFLGNRLGLDVTHFTSTNGPQIFPLPVASSSGYSSQVANAVTTQKNGWEVALTGAVLANPTGLSWDVLANWSTYKETLKEIYGNEQSIYLAGPNHVFTIGDRLDGYYSYNFLRAPDGQIIQSSTGTPLTRPSGTNTQQLLGYTNPDWVWGVTNRFSYKNFNFSFQFDGRVGGVIRDQVYAYAMNSGNQPELVQGALGAARLQEWQSTNLGTKAPTPAYVGPGVVVANGGTVQFDANGNISNLSSLEFTPNTKAVTVQTYAQGIYNSGIEEPYMVSKTYAKLREVIIGYSFPSSLLASRFIKGANISLVGRNLLYFAQRKDFDLDQYAQGYSASSQSTLKNPSLQSATTRSMGVNINLTF